MKILAFGEILFDCYPTATKIGGAPFNFCAHLAKLGGDCALYSAVGDDALGKEARSFAEKHGVDTRFLSIHRTLPTGVCKVTYQNSEPCYNLGGTYAYDEILPDETVLAEGYDVFYFGTLALRNEVSRKTCKKLLSEGNFALRFFDMNLRQHYYSEELVKEGLFSCHIVKMNREEYLLIKKISSVTEEEPILALEKICRIYNIQTAIVTLDRDGACLWDEQQGYFSVPAQTTGFVSAVGAGDSFCACFLYHYLLGHSMQICLEKASVLAGYVVSFEEAIPHYSDKILTKLTSEL